GDTGRGVRAVMNKLVELMPSPVDAGSFEVTIGKGETTTELQPSDSEPLTAIVFKTTQEPRVGELTYFRVFSGTVRGGMTVSNPGRSTTERLSHPAIPDGANRSEVDVLHAGDIGVIAKLKDTHTGDTLCAEGKDLRLATIDWPKPDIAIAIYPVSRGEEDKLANGLNRVHEEDPTFMAAFDPEIGQTIACGLGELHLNVAIERLKRKFGVHVETEAPRIAYRETITKNAEGQGRYKKQTGGRGQYGDCWLRLAPRSRGEGFEFISKIVGGVIPTKFVPAVGKGVKEALSRGILAGYPVVDVAVVCYDGSYHAVDSSEQAFKIAGSMAFQKVAKSAGPIVLEPILEIEVRTPEEFMGEVIGDLNQRRGRIMGMDTEGHWQVVRAKVPEAEMYRYSTALRSLTQGKAAHKRELAGYEPAPADVKRKIIAEAEARKEEEHR
ncbi:MAG: EF-Tu/IF-2/RF-3 family GTPase, partial [Gemmatimonadota bacterium]